jgi:alpha-glucoside transport system substrate-binding protein
MFSKKRILLFSFLLIFAMILAACGGGDADNSNDNEEPAAQPTEAEATGGEEEAGGEEEMEAPQGGDAILEAAYNGDYSGTVVEVFGAFVDEDARRFETSIAAFEEATGIDIQYEGSGDFETLIQVRVEGGDPPDIAGHPQPGLLKGLVEQGAVVDPSEFLGMDFLEAHYDSGWTVASNLGGQVAGVWYRANVKSLVWYPKDDFEAAGYEIPTTWDELLALSDQIVADGSTPWCIGIESSGATGWPATDWIEDIMLRTTTPEKYDEWTAGELPFDSPEVRNAIETMAVIWKNPDYVLGGDIGIATTPFGDSPTPMFDDPPSCWFHRQASFITAFFPDGTEIGTDADFFYFPGIDPAYGEPVLTAGDIAAMYNDRPEVRAVMAYLATGESMKGWVEAGGFIAPHSDSSLDWYTTDIDRRFAEMMLNASVTRFDGSDLMPAAVGAGAFWTEITDWVTGKELDEALPEIDAAWPR